MTNVLRLILAAKWRKEFFMHNVRDYRDRESVKDREREIEREKEIKGERSRGRGEERERGGERGLVLLSFNSQQEPRRS